VGLLVGLASFGLLASRLDDSGQPARQPTAFDSIVPAAADRDAIASEGPPPAAAQAATPEAAVRAFLEAEVRGDHAASFTALDSATRADRGPLGAWVAGSAERPRYTGFEVSAVDGDRVVTTVNLRPQLDETLGLVPAAATIEWAVVAEDGGWRLDLDASELEPVYPDDAGAARAAVAWARTRQACERSNEYGGSLLLSPTLADSLCGSAGTVTAGRAATLAALTDAGPVVTAFGEGALDWARVVEIHGPTDLAVVTAPLGDQWVVVGVSSG
jgi:hypothetical protein